MIDPPSSDSTTATDIISSSTSKSDFSLHDVKDTLISADKLTTAETDTDNICRQIMNKFEEAMSDDLNTPRAVAELFALVSYTEKLLSSVNNENSSISSISGGVSNIAVMTRTQAKIILQSVYNMDLVFGLFYSVPSDYFPDFAAGSSNSDASGASGSVPEAVVVLAQSRMEAKKNKQFALADSLRDQISDLGYIVKDKKDGFDLVRK